MNLQPAAASSFVADRWERAIVPALHDYIRIPNRSPAFDRDWAERGDMERAVTLIRDWLAAEGTGTVEVQRLEGRTPLIVVDVPPTSSASASSHTAGGAAATTDTVLLYGHLDKQPEMVGWREGLGPWEPVREGDLLYGRGGADDGYSAFAAITAIRAVREAGGEHQRCLLVIEASEESGSPDLEAHIDALGDRLGDVSLVVCLDSGCASYDRLWTTTSLRGLVMADVRVDIVREGIHSGASGVVPSSFRIARALLSRLEDEATGTVLLPSMQVTVPAERREQAEATAVVLGKDLWQRYPLVEGARPVTSDLAELVLNRTWRAAVSVVGAAGLPDPADAGNVLRPHTTLKLSVRIPPRCDEHAALSEMLRTLTTDVPYGAKVTVADTEAAPGWDAPPTAPWLAAAIEAGSKAAFGSPPAAEGEGGTIPFMAMLGERFPDAQFVVTGVLGPGSNAHGPNEFLHIPMGIGVTEAVAHVLDAHARR